MRLQAQRLQAEVASVSIHSRSGTCSGQAGGGAPQQQEQQSQRQQQRQPSGGSGQRGCPDAVVPAGMDMQEPAGKRKRTGPH